MNVIVSCNYISQHVFLTNNNFVYFLIFLNTASNAHCDLTVMRLLYNTQSEGVGKQHSGLFCYEIC
jgi:hypothetical protein